MASYESDSSDGEFEETNVLLGYASKDADEDTISRLGGYPVSPRTLVNHVGMRRLINRRYTGLVRRHNAPICGPGTM